jgi:O-acetylserine/cysteine efflux transporter
VVPVPALALSLLLDGPGEVGSAIAGFSWHAALATLYTAVLASLLGYGIFNTLLGRNQPSAVVPWVLLAPVVAMAAAWWLLGDRPNTAELAGGVVMLVGVLVALRPRPRSGPRPRSSHSRAAASVEDAGQPVSSRHV